MLVIRTCTKRFAPMAAEPAFEQVVVPVVTVQERTTAVVFEESVVMTSTV